jgi:[protein-PII] uridylyltransferase
MQNKYEHASKRLKQKRERLTSSFLKGKEPDFLKSHAQILDDYFCESFEKSMVGPCMEINKNPYAIIAVGGYGRKEQCVHSDVDLLFLFKKRIPDKTDDLIREILYPLWDIGLDIGHATRSLKESVKLAGEDLEVLTSILDARYICGISLLYSELMEQLRKKVILKQANKIIICLIENSRNRHQRFGDSTYLLEPNLKEGQGGLRDYHTMLWIARIKYNLKEPRDLEYFGCLSQNEFQTLTKALSFIWDVRNHLHHITGKKCDQLYFEYQPKLAGSLKFNKKEALQPVERFLGKLHGEMEFIKQQNLMFLYEHETAKKGFHIKRLSLRLF